MGKLKVGVVGATGAVGQRLVGLLNGHPWFEVAALAGSEQTTGKLYGEKLRPLPATARQPDPALLSERLRAPQPESFAGCAVVFSALPADAARELEPRLAQAGLGVISNASAFRMDADVPLIVPEVNPEHLGLLAQQRAQRGWSGFIVTNPNCSTISLTLALAPLHQAFGLRRVFATTLQAISGAGYNGVSGLEIIDNVVPYIGGEEDKMETEPRKLLGTVSGERGKSQRIELADFKLSAQCTRVATTDGHMEMISLELARAVTIEEVLECWRSWQPRPQQLGLPSAPVHPLVLRDEPNRPQPRFDRDVENGMATVIGRLRPCPLLDYKFALLGHNLLRGAAGGVLLIAELLKAEGWIGEGDRALV